MPNLRVTFVTVCVLLLCCKSACALDTLWNTMQTDPALQPFANLIKSSPVYAPIINVFLQSEKNVTVFVPNATALATSTLDWNDTYNTLAILSYHVALSPIDIAQMQPDEKVFPESFLTNQTLVQLGQHADGSAVGQRLFITKGSSMDSSAVIQYGFSHQKSVTIPGSQRQCSDGIIHMIDSVLQYPLSFALTLASAPQFGSVWDVLAVQSGALSTVNAPATSCFVPSNTAFVGTDLSLWSAEDQRNLVKFHCIPSQGLTPGAPAVKAFYTTEFDRNPNLRTSLGNLYMISTSHNGHSILISQYNSMGTKALLQMENILTSNGVIHITSAILPVPFNNSQTLLRNLNRLPSMTETVRLLNDPALTNVKQYLDVLHPQQFTALLPSNDAWGSTSIDKTNMFIVKSIFMYSIAYPSITFGSRRQFVTSTYVSLNLGQKGGNQQRLQIVEPDTSNFQARVVFGIPMTLGGEAIMDVSKGEDGWQGRNGNMYIMDSVISLPGDVSSYVNTSDSSPIAEFRRFTALLSQYPGYLDSATDGRSITIFAPSDSAMEKYSIETRSQAEITTILSRHISTNDPEAPAWIPYELASPITLPTFEGSNVIVSSDVNGQADVRLDKQGAGKHSILVPDIMLSNGVLHVIDGVLGLDDFPKNPSSPGDDGLTHGQVAAVVICILIAVAFGAFLFMKYVYKKGSYQFEIAASEEDMAEMRDVPNRQVVGYGAV